MSGVLHGILASLKTAVAVVTDAYFKYVSLLLNTTCTNGAQNNTFLDSSANAFTVTRNGDTTQGSFNPYMPTGYWSGYFDGTGDGLSTPDDAALEFDSGNFTIEFWVCPLSTTGWIAGKGNGSTAAGSAFTINLQNQWAFYSGSTGYGITQPTLAVGEWAHCAIVRNGTTITAYKNGVSFGSVNISTNSINNVSQGVSIGQYGVNAPIVGYISNFRIVKGTAVYTANFTPPATPLTAITNTSLLCLQDNRFIDNSTNAFAITRNGDTRISKFAPFNPPASYSTATYGGSGYFDGTGDFLSVPASSQFLPGANTDFTFEAWVYLTATPSAQSAQVVGTGEYGTSADWNIVVNSSRQPSFYFATPPTGFSITSSVALDLYTWNHIAVTRSGTGTNNLKMFLNGVNVAQASRNDTMDYTGDNLTIGADQNGDEAVFTGYISGLRLLNGTGYTSISVPTAPPTNITNTVLLLNFDNAGIYDASTINDAQTVGNAQVSTTQAKFGTTSMYFNATGDRLIVPNRQELRFGAGDFTIEFWVYFNSLTGYRQILNTASSSGTSDYSYAMVTNGTSLLYYLSSTGTSWDLVPGSSIGTVSTGQWFHVALVRNGSTFTPYLNGVAAPTATSSAALFNFATPLPIGALTAPPMQGYLQDFRITKGYARYTGNFTPPTAAFPTL